MRFHVKSLETTRKQGGANLRLILSPAKKGGRADQMRSDAVQDDGPQLGDGKFRGKRQGFFADYDAKARTTKHHQLSNLATEQKRK